MDTARSPGVYVERVEPRAAGLELLETGVPCFLGLTERGPTNRPVEVRSLDAFHERFGSLDGHGYLAEAIDGFFLNGGKRCFVVRIAHLFERARNEIATPASVRLRDAAGLNTLQIQAVSEGMWGDALRVSVERPDTEIQTFITVDAKADDHSVMVKSTYGFARGTLVRVFDDNESAYRVLTAVEGRTLVWSEREPLGRTFKSMSPTLVEPVSFDLRVESHRDREVFRGLNLARQSPRFAERVINTQSQLIAVTSLESTSPAPDNLPVATDDKPLALEGGADGLFTVTAEDFIGADLGPGHRYGLSALDEVEDVDLVLAPDLAWCLQRSAGFKSPKDMEVVQQAMVQHCELRKDRFAILDLPPDTTPRGALQWRRLFDSSYAAIYYPWLVPSRGPRRLVPPSGHIAGIYARCDAADGVFRAPANETLEGVVDLELFLQQRDLAMLNDEGINCSQVFNQRGIRVWGARTTAGDARWRYVNVRRTVAAITRSLRVGLAWVVFESNNHDLWQAIGRDVTYFLDGLWREGFLRGEARDEAFLVQCDVENNPLASREAGLLNVDIWLAPFRPAEFIGVRITQQLDALTREDGAQAAG